MSVFYSLCLTFKTPHFYALNMDAVHPIELDKETESDQLTTLKSGDTPTLDDSVSPTIKALDAARKAADDAAFNLVVARMPSDHRIKVRGIHYVLYNPYRPRKSKRSAWYWAPVQGQEEVEILRAYLERCYYLEGCHPS
jgi:hypothetical protein